MDTLHLQNPKFSWGEQLEHSYREIFVNLANDTGNNEGQPIEDGGASLVFGIPPSMSVIWERIHREIDEQCYREIDYDKIKAAGSIRFGNRARQKKYKSELKKQSLE